MIDLFHAAFPRDPIAGMIFLLALAVILTFDLIVAGLILRELVIGALGLADILVSVVEDVCDTWGKCEKIHNERVKRPSYVPWENFW